MIYVRFAAFEVSDGTVVKIPPAGVTVFVGPNNAGKSQSLRDLLGLVGQPQSHIGRAIVGVELVKTGAAEDFKEWLVENIPETRTADGQVKRMVGEYGLMAPGQQGGVWGNQLLQYIAPLFVYHADATSRLTAASSVPNINFGETPVTHPLQRAFLDGSVEHDVRRAARSAFGTGLVVDQYAGNVIALRVGDPPEFEHDRGVPASGYIKSLRKLPLLEQQGDGMRSYIGLLLHMMGGVHQVTLVDEPEAFLHPP